jgi:flavin reductase (DIM6/NTAB) family NADH-FMN oxidoreductase RutF
MIFDMETLEAQNRYKILTATVTPRPIAWVTTLSESGVINAAPFSFFNVMGSDPPLVALGIGDRASGGPKDTARNIALTKHFVVNLVDESLAEGMNVCAVDFPVGVDELRAAGLTCAPSVLVPPPRIAESPVHLECREVATLEIGNNRLVVGEVLHLQVRDDFVDDSRLHVHAERLRLIGRMHGSGWYARTSDLFQMPRLTYEQWRAARP